MSRAAQGPSQPAILDLGVGNLGNLRRALAHVGADAEITSDPARVAAARCLLLPGVGAFRPPREALRGPLEDALRQALADGAHLLGICVGFQLLFESSVEFGESDGLGLLGGRITRLPEGSAEVPPGERVVLPHIGWNRLVDLAEHPLVEGIEEGGAVYFVHSFAPEDTPLEQALAHAEHGRRFPAVAGAGRVYGTQFHPEKSGPLGLRLLANYLEICGATDSGH